MAACSCVRVQVTNFKLADTKGAKQSNLPSAEKKKQEGKRARATRY